MHYVYVCEENLECVLLTVHVNIHVSSPLSFLAEDTAKGRPVQDASVD